MEVAVLIVNGRCKMIGFNLDKTIEAAAYLIKQQPEAVESYMRLLKLLYIADRTSLAERLAPISGDIPYAMRQGPVPSATLDLIKGNDPRAEQWERYIKRIDFHVQLIKDPGNRHLSRAEINILDRVSEQFRNCDEWDLVHWCHKRIPEYTKAWKSRGDRKRVRIPLEDVLAAIGLSDRQEQIVAQQNADLGFTRLFGDHLPTDAG
jgi:uncharacterized phage-associated protein